MKVREREREYILSWNDDALAICRNLIEFSFDLIG